jgi:AAA domain, putative AbiEii toxin, Type IV TA system
MAVKHIDLERFTVFEKLSLDFSPGINVFLGANATGKSHLMKVVYSVLRAWRDVLKELGPNPKQGAASERLSEGLRAKFAGVFHPERGSVDRLIRGNRGPSSAAITTSEGTELTGKLYSTGHFGTNVVSNFDPVPAAVFLPAREVLSMYEGFTAAYENRELSFDETYYDTCKALSATPLKGPKVREAESLLEPLKERLQADVKRSGDRFYVEMPGEAPFEAHLVAEGFRKLASVIYLIRNGSLAKGGVLFWDEPEANLNPWLIKTVADFLLKLAGSGVQIFVATHDYLLTNELSLHAEYQTKDAEKANIRFFGFHRESSGPVQVQTGAMLADLDQNPIMEEFAALYDRERKLFQES